MNLNKRFEKEKVMMEQIELLESQHEILLIDITEGLETQEKIEELHKLDRTIDHRRRMYELHVKQTNKLIYG